MHWSGKGKPRDRLDTGRPPARQNMEVLLPLHCRRWKQRCLAGIRARIVGLVELFLLLCSDLKLEIMLEIIQKSLRDSGTG